MITSVIHRGKFEDRGMSRFFAERAWQLILGTVDNYTEHPMSEEHHRMTGYRDSPVVSEVSQENLMPAVDPNVHNLPVGVNYDEN